MFTCHVCGGQEYREELVSEVFTIGGRRVLVEGIPARVCERCGEGVYTSETTERVRTLVHESPRPDRTVSLDVYALT